MYRGVELGVDDQQVAEVLVAISTRVNDPYRDAQHEHIEQAKHACLVAYRSPR